METEVYNEAQGKWQFDGIEKMNEQIDYGHWSTEIVGTFDPDEWFGFVYLIINLSTNQKYIGRKQIKSKIRRKVAGRKNRKITIKDSDWRTYISSSNEVQALISDLGTDNFKFIILCLCKTKGDLGYEETSEQFKRDVLKSRLENGEREYYNKNIMSRWFAGPSTGPGDGNTNAKGNKGKPKSAEHKAKLAEVLRRSNENRKGKTYDEVYGESKSQEWRDNQSLGRLGKPHPHNRPKCGPYNKS